MKQIVNYLALICLFIPIGICAQSGQTNEGNFAYRLNGHVFLNELNLQKKKIDTTKNYSADKFLFEKVGTFNDNVKNGQKTESIPYYKIKLVPFKLRYPARTDLVDSMAIKDIKVYGTRTKTTKAITNENETKLIWIDTTSTYVDNDDLDKIFVIRESEFDKLIKDEFILKEYETWFGFKDRKSLSLSYGIQITVPFKLRPSIDTLNMKITPEIGLGGFIGPKIRLDKYKPVFLHAPIFTAGVSAVGISKDNVIDVSKVTGDGLVLARNYSLGAIIDYEGFQFGFMMGWDKPSGQIGKNWVYSDRPWYSFALGFNFLNFNKEKNAE